MMLFVEQQKVSFSVPRRWCRDHHHFLRTHLGLSLLLFSSSAFRCWNTTKLLFCIARLIVRVPFYFCFFFKENRKDQHVDAEKQEIKEKKRNTSSLLLMKNDDDDARLFLDLFSRLFSVRTFHANYRSAATLRDDRQNIIITIVRRRRRRTQHQQKDVDDTPIIPVSPKLLLRDRRVGKNAERHRFYRFEQHL